VTYSDWSATCYGTSQSRTVLTRTPAGCSLTTAQQLDTQKTCSVATSTPPVIPPVTPPVTPPATDLITDITSEAGILNTQDTNQLLGLNGSNLNNAGEAASALKYKTVINLDSRLTVAEEDAINNFIYYGTPTTQRLGAGERAAVLNSYFQAYSKLPNSEAEWSDVLKIASGRWPTERSAKAEAQAKVEFAKVYKRNAVMTNNIDENAIMVIAYGLLPLNRNLNSERVAIKTFRYVYGHDPVNALAWNIVRAIAYSGATR
jgi:hypothetical protein